ncbi:MAG: aldehyde dehydrogenase family protein, partial [Geodermatophilaceae bacterium]|nr:aldehyde dehydrogenase family protein [Geodermatophilaceae bacterium]
MADSAAVLQRTPTGVFIAGQWREATGGGTFAVADPGTGKPLTRVADGQAEDAVAALDAAVDAQESWAGTPARERGEILRRAWQLMVDRADDLALLMTLEMGKSLAESRAEVTYA